MLSFLLGSIHTGDNDFDKAVSRVNTLIININVTHCEMKSLLLIFVKTPIRVFHGHTKYCQLYFHIFAVSFFICTARC